MYLSPAQVALLDAAATGPLTLCHGPPGTGKTFTLAAAAIKHALRDEAVLIVCRSRQAANVIARTVDGISGTGTMTLRAGDRAALELQELETERMGLARRSRKPASSPPSGDIGTPYGTVPAAPGTPR